VKLFVTLGLAACACAAVAFNPAARSRLRQLTGSRIVWALGALMVLSVLALVTTRDMRLSILGAYPNYTGLTTIAAWIMLGLAATATPRDELRQTLGRGVALSLVAVGLYAASQRFGFDPMPASAAFDSGRAASTLGNAANLGVFIALALPLAMDRALAEQHRAWRLLGWAALVLGAAAAGFSGSRGAWAGLGVGMLVAAVSSVRARQIQRRVALAAVVVVLALSIAFTPVAAARVTGGGTGAATVAGRLAVWSATLPMIAERPFLGWGPSGFGIAHTAYMTPAEVDPRGRVEALDDPHNLVLSVATSCGVPGVLALLAIVGLSVSALLKSHSTDDGWSPVLAAALAGGFVALQFHFVTLDTGAALAIVLGAVVGVEIGEAVEVEAGGRALWLVLGLTFLALAVAAVGLVAADAYVREGFARAEEGEWDNATAAFDSASWLAPWEPAILWATGRASTGPAMSDPRARAYGVRALRTAIDRMPGDARPLRDLGDLYIASSVGAGSGDWSSALEVYEQALVLAPLDPRAWLGRGVAQAGLGDLTAAADSMRASLELAPRFSDAWENLAAVYDASGDTAAAQAARDRAQTTR
jgi:O-antigen ligase